MYAFVDWLQILIHIYISQNRSTKYNTHQQNNFKYVGTCTQKLQKEEEVVVLFVLTLGDPKQVTVRSYNMTKL